MKYFFKLVRLILGPFLLLKEQLSKPKGLVRSAADQARVDAECQQLALYQFTTCPFCIKVRQEMRRLSLNVEQHDAQHSAENRQALLAQGGSSKVPCLKIVDADNQTRWLYNSREIIAYLQQRFAVAH
ncbi:MAG: glutathione S-transferase N-terminal domain-containing protein [Herminiimonas sp.]|uniref:glutaredoxin family protein n=1 Tax=Herminiimonas sp. TaxID=1926289 RepID=UPI00271D7850|nr:glutathione S-transferase N-terminal domain-containing protein [Herminiimonas sp.]MDO9420497.1 glutathione S-transferase N-terminal domain-containing protein [Herminiimonas sp.]